MKGKAWALWAALAFGALLLLCAGLLGAALVFELPQHVPSIVINGHELDFGDPHFAHWVVATTAVLIVMLSALFVVPLAVLISAALPMLMALAVTVALLSPLLLIAWLIWQASRRRRAGATIAS